jgi:hypothetical protein
LVNAISGISYVFISGVVDAAKGGNGGEDILPVLQE